MTLKETFPLIFVLNLGRRADRRGEIEWQLAEANIDAERFPSIDARYVKSARGYKTKPKYALALSKRLAIREARKRGAESVLILEDDVLFHPNLHSLFERLELPDDWGLFFFGCSHERRPEVVSSGLVKITYAVDNHAFAVHSRYYNQLIRAMDLLPAIRSGEDLEIGLASDRIIADLQKTIPTYAAAPNLAWQAETHSDLVGKKYSLYSPSGTPKNYIDLNRSVLNEMVTGEKEARRPKLALLFLTRGDVNHPKIWEEWIAQSPDDVRVFSHSENLENITSDVLSGTQIDQQEDTAWGDISLVRATVALLKAALEDETITHFALVSESCVPVRPLGEVLRRLYFDPRPQFNPLPFEKSPKRFRVKVAKINSLPSELWRFHSQWILFDRTTAILSTRNDYTSLMESMMAPDETYFGTVLHMEGYPLDDFVFSEKLTWTHWQKDAGSPDAHQSISPKHLSEIVSGHYLFARKFPSSSDIGKHGLHQPPAN